MATLKHSMQALATLAVIASPQVAKAADNLFLRQRTVLVWDRVPKGYEAQSLRLGAFTVSPQLTVDVSRNDNIFYDNTRKVADTIVGVAPEVVVSSNWGRHQLRAMASARHESFADNDSENVTTWTLAGDGRLDIGAADNLDFSVDVGRNYQPRFDPIAPQSVAEPVKFNAFNARLGGTKIANRLKFTGNLLYSSYDYDNAVTVAGTILPQKQRNYNRSTIVGRAEYALTPDVSMYVTYAGNKVAYENVVGRDSDGYEAAVGASFDLPDRLTGEIQVGHLRQKYQSPQFRPSEGDEFTAKVSWLVTPLTVVTVQTGRELRESPDPVASGIFTTSSTVRVDHELLRTLVLTAAYTTIRDDYNGVERKYDRKRASFGARYLVSPNIALTGTIQGEKLRSEGVSPSRAYDDTSVRIGIVFKK